MNASSGKKKIPISCVIAAAITGVLVILVTGTVLFFFFRYRQAGNLHTDASPSRVIISQPGNRAQFTAGAFIQVEVNAAGQQPFTSTELWINGVLEGVEAIPVAGRTSITTNFWWTPPEGGTYSLVARTINQENGTASSPAVIVFIAPPDYSGQPDPEAGKTHPAVLPAPPAGITSPQPPAPMMFRPRPANGRVPRLTG